MRSESDPKETALVPVGSKALTTRSSALVRRGLETLASLQIRVVHFPSDRSMGKLLLYEPVKNVSQKLGDARGDVIVPPGMKLSLDISDEAVLDLSPLSSLKPEDLQSLIVWATAVSNEDLEHISQLGRLEHLFLYHGNQITDWGLAYFRELTSLSVLSLGTPNITDAGLVHLKNLTRLERLTLRTCKLISDAGLAHIIALKNLRRVHLDSKRITGVGLSHLVQLPLEELSLSNAHISDAEIAKYVQGLTDLKMLDLEGTHITDSGLKFLEPLKKLQHLELAHCKISDSGLVHLQNLRALEWLTLSHTKVSQEAITSLQEALPNCRILTRDL